MFGRLANRLPVFFVPVLLLVVACLLVPRLPELPVDRQELLLNAPYLVTVLGAFLSIHFHRGRPLLALLLLIISYWAFHTYLLGKDLEYTLSETYQAFVFLVPLDIALIALMRERGAFSPVGRARFTFLVVQGGIAYWFFRYNFVSVIPYLAADFGMPGMVTPALFPQPALVFGTICFILTAALALRRQTPIEAGLCGALIAFYIACNRITSPQEHALFSTAGALILMLSVLRDSYNMAFRDEMTGLRSRRSLNESLSGLGRKYAIAMLDVDHFKNFNDTYGHDTGDQVLKMVASKMMAVGCGGKAFRYGGEEFTILFPGRQTADVIPELENIRGAIADYRMAIRDATRPKDSKAGKVQRGTKRESGSISVTISIGVADRSEILTTPEDVLKAADKALYKAKNKGRNMVCS
ncbi:MAG: GGDEF domain-containing protein [Desulfuromonadaceae bacterium]|nr:GGDEF domain-containing protein [Desulfuromonadaceae bacterium]MDD5105118.1 GGDEF domain-containing protein [Desulfuromonadaceae bacterium]